MKNGLRSASASDALEHDTIDWQSALAEHDRWLRTAVYARLREPHAVDDVMQEVALAAVRQSAPIRDPTLVGPWLYRLAIHQVLMYRRKRGRQRNLVDRFAARVPNAERTSPDPLAWLLADERQTMVRRAMDELPARDAEILMLKYSEDWSYDDIARHLGISRSAVEARLHRARGRLREKLSAYELMGTKR